MTINVVRVQSLATDLNALDSLIETLHIRKTLPNEAHISSFEDGRLHTMRTHHSDAISPATSDGDAFASEMVRT